MDASEQIGRLQKSTDAIAERVQKLFNDFLEEYVLLLLVVKFLFAGVTQFLFDRFIVDGEVKYLQPAEALVRPERNTLTVSFNDIELYNQQLATSIQEEYYRFVVKERWWIIFLTWFKLQTFVTVVKSQIFLL